MKQYSIKGLLLELLLLQSMLSLVSSQNSPDAVKLGVSDKDLTIVYEKSETFDVELDGLVQSNFSLLFVEEHDDLVLITPQRLFIGNTNGQNVSRTYEISVLGVNPGRLEVYAESIPEGYVNADNVFVRITIAMSKPLIYISITIGWIYFAAWSISFYPQMIINFRRKSVVGLNFDFLALNIMGHTLYAVFNSSLYWSTYIENEYFDRNPRGMNPVLLNDVLFSLHASLLTLFTIIQCFFYERGEQRVSYTAMGLMGIAGLFLIISAIIAATDTIHWLDFLYYCSYVKLAISIIKYLPQAIMNYRRKSTEGWSIENIILDFTGGMLSMLQMLLNGYNYDDWKSIFGDPTKFGLGLFSVIFDIVFMIQHYVLYRHKSNKINDDSSNTNASDSLTDVK